jgi:hypothetical protein
MTAKTVRLIYGVTERNGRSYWARIGVAFVNQDGSENLLFDFLPTSPKATIQIRDRAPKDSDIAAHDSEGANA